MIYYDMYNVLMFNNIDTFIFLILILIKLNIEIYVKLVITMYRKNYRLKKG